MTEHLVNCILTELAGSGGYGSELEDEVSYSEVLFKVLTLLVNILYTTTCAYVPLP